MILLVSFDVFKEQSFFYVTFTSLCFQIFLIFLFFLEGNEFLLTLKYTKYSVLDNVAHWLSVIFKLQQRSGDLLL